MSTVRDYYAANPLMVSSPFGGVDAVNEGLFRHVMDALAIEFSGRSVLDVGCGRGFLEPIVKTCGGAYTGVDFVPSRAGFRLALADAQRLPFPDASFDILLCIDAYEHLPDGAAVAREFRRVLRPSGTVFLSVPNYANVAGMVKWMSEHWGSYERNTWAPFRNWQPQELELPLTARRVRAAFRAAGFAALRRIGYGPEVGLGLFPWVEHAKMPEALKFRLQRVFAAAGPAVVRLWPGASLHAFWRINAE